MARYHFIGRLRDSYGNTIPNGDVSVYLAGTTTPAIVYTQAEGGQGISTIPQIKSDENGYVSFYVDDGDYEVTQLFDIVSNNFTYSNIDIFGTGALQEAVIDGGSF